MFLGEMLDSGKGCRGSEKKPWEDKCLVLWGKVNLASEAKPVMQVPLASDLSWWGFEVISGEEHGEEGLADAFVHLLFFGKMEDMQFYA